MGSKDNLALDLEHGVRRWDRARWISVFSSHNPTIREVTECLGLGLSASSSTTNRGIPKFDNPDYRKLSNEVTKLSKELPKERDALLDFAADPNSLNRELEELLATYGPIIWSKDADRACLLTPEPSKKTYNKNLFFEELEHRNILKIHLHRWIIIKACYYIRNMKLKRPSGANDGDSVIDMDGESGSPRSMSQSLTPPERHTSAGAEMDAKRLNEKKRKTSNHASISDSEEHSSTPIKRQYHTMPFQRRSKSPRRSIQALAAASPGSIENVPPLPSQRAHVSPSPGAEGGPVRIQLSTLSGSELNGVARPPHQPSAGANNFTAVNNGGITSVNNAIPLATKDSSRDLKQDRSPSKEFRHSSPAHTHRDVKMYTSPYESSTYGIAQTRRPSDPSTANAATRVQTLNPDTAASQTAPRDSIVAQHPHHMPIAPHPPIQPQPTTSSMPPQRVHSRPPSRTHTPTGHRPIAPHPLSRSNTPHAPANSNLPTLPPNPPPAPAPAQSAPIAPAHAIPHHGPPQNNASAGAIPPQQTYQQPSAQQQSNQSILKSQPTEAHAVQRPVFPLHEFRLLQCEVTSMLLQYLFPRATALADETTLLHRLNTLWYHGESAFRAELGVHYDMTSKILNAWLHERQAIAALRHSLAAQPGVQPQGLIDRLLAMNDLRVMRLKWKNMSTVDGVSPEDILCRAFAVMTLTDGTDFLFKEGLERLNAAVFDFLRSEDTRIVMQRR